MTADLFFRMLTLGAVAWVLLSIFIPAPKAVRIKSENSRRSPDDSR